MYINIKSLRADYTWMLPLLITLLFHTAAADRGTPWEKLPLPRAEVLNATDNEWPTGQRFDIQRLLNDDNIQRGLVGGGGVGMRDRKDRILHCPPGSGVNREVQHSETSHLYINYVVKTCIFSLIIAAGILCNAFLLAVIQYFQVSQYRPVLRAELVAIIAYLVFLIPLYPVANLYPYTGQLELYEVAKPYVTPFFQTCLDIAELLTIWIFVCMARVRYILVALWKKRRAERCTPKAVRDELRILTCFAIVLNLPKFFDTNVVVDNDPCNPGEIIVMREPNGLGSSFVYQLMYEVIALSLAYYIIPFIYLAKLTYATHHALRKSEIPSGDTKQDAMRDRSKVPDGITTELDRRILLFYVLLLPGAFLGVALRIQFILPSTRISLSGYQQIIDVSITFVMSLTITHAAFAPIIVYSTAYEAFKSKAKEQYWDKYVDKYRDSQRRRQLEKDFEDIERRLRNEEMNPKTMTIDLESDKQADEK